MGANSSIYPDLLVDGQLSDGEPISLYCEHKWDSPCNEEQLKKYLVLAKNKGEHAQLIFVGANYKQRSEAVKCFQEDECKCFLWEDIFRSLDAIPEKSSILQEFLDFMKNQGLSPGQPLTVERMTAFLQVSDFVQSLKNLAHKIDTNYPWAAIPERYYANRDVNDAYERVAIGFGTKDWRPAITVGFLYDVKDHRVTLVNRDKGIDLLLRIEAEPKSSRNIQPALDVLKAKREQLKNTAASVLLKGERGNGNSHSILIVRDCLGDVIDNVKTEGDQLTAIHKKLTTWLEILFKDGKLENGFKKSFLDSGMK